MTEIERALGTGAKAEYDNPTPAQEKAAKQVPPPVVPADEVVATPDVDANAAEAPVTP